MSAVATPELFRDGYTLDFFEPPLLLQQAVQLELWAEVDQRVADLVQPGGAMFEYVSRYLPIISTEFIISIRDATDPDQDDGIWHDDGSRRITLTWSLTSEPIEGGLLGIRARGQATPVLIPTPPFGGLIVYLTGQFGFEHKIHRVTRGRRIVIACWGS